MLDESLTSGQTGRVSPPRNRKQRSKETEHKAKLARDAKQAEERPKIVVSRRSEDEEERGAADRRGDKSERRVLHDL